MPFFSKATHIVGGEISYRCLGDNTFEITLNVYRDCDTGIEPFDDPAYIAIYDGANNLIESIGVAYMRDDTLDAGVFNECLKAPSNICVHSTTYRAVVNLPDNPIGGYYHVVYQRCCRNATVQNILQPLYTGAVYDIMITQSAMNKCNSSPVIKNWPPVFICLGEPIIFDHSGTDDFDLVNDSLVYTLCTPFTGGTFDDPKPIPPENPPPFDTVTWNSPTYSKENMLGIGDPSIGERLEIDPVTGEITGLPTIPGQFVVGICIYEYDKETGELLSMTRRDFQYNIGLCEQNPILGVAETQCSDDLKTYTVQFETDGYNVTNDKGVLTKIGNDLFQVTGIPVGDSLTISASSIAGSCVMEEKVAPPDCSCETNSNVLNPVSNGDQTICEGDPIPNLVVMVQEGEVADWFDAPTGGNVLAVGSNSFSPSMPGTYYVEARNTINDCISSERTPVTLIINEKPSIDLAANGIVCAESLLTYSVELTTDADQIEVNSGTISNLGSGRFQVTAIPIDTDLKVTAISTNTGCQAILDVKAPICNCDLETVDAPISGGDFTVCEGDPFPSLVVTTADGIVADWYDAPTGGTLLAAGINSYTPNQEGTYYAEARKEVNGCVSSVRTSVQLTVNAIPQLSIDLTSRKCALDLSGYSVIFTSDGVEFMASSGTISPLGDGNYEVVGIQKGVDLILEARNPITGCFVKDTVPGLPCDCSDQIIESPLSGGDQVICEGDPIPALTVNVGDGATVDWFADPDGGQLLAAGTTSYTPESAGTFYVQTRVIVNGCESPERSAISLNIIEQPKFELTQDSVACNMSLTTYSVTFTTDAENIVVTIGELTTLNNDVRKIDLIPVDSSVTIILENVVSGCSRSVTINSPNCDCEVVDVPLPISGGDQTICEGDPIPVLSASVPSGFTVDWYDDPFSGNLLLEGSTSFTPTAEGIYYAAARSFLNECPSNSRVAVELIVNDLPTVDLFGDGVECADDKQSYNVTIITWADMVEANSGIVVSNGNGVFEINGIATDVNLELILTNTTTGCKKDTTIIAPECTCDLEDVAPPTSNGDQAICVGDDFPALSVTTPGGVTVDWYDAPTGGNLLLASSNSFTPTAAGTYYAEARQMIDNCISSERTAISLTINPLPTFSLEDNGVQCTPDLLSYQVSFVTDASSISLNEGTLVSNGNDSYMVVNIPLELSLMITLVNEETGCTYERTILPADCNCETQNIQAPRSNGDVAYCLGSPIPTISVTVQPGETVDWFDAPTGGNLLANDTLMFTPPAPGTYYAETDVELNDCFSTTRTPIVVTEQPLPSFSQDGNPVCALDLMSYSVRFNTEEGNTAVVNFGVLTDLGNGIFSVENIPNGQSISITVLNPETDCSNQVTINAPTCDCSSIEVPAPISNGDMTYCPGDPIPTLSVSVGDGQTADWYDAPEGGSLLAGGTTTFTPPSEGMYYAATRIVVNDCISTTRTPVSLSLLEAPTYVMHEGPTCSEDLMTYSILISTTADNFISNTGNISIVEDGQYLVTGVMVGTDLSLRLIDVTTGCETAVEVSSPECTCEVLQIMPPVSGGDQAICEGELIPELSATTDDGMVVDWYDAPVGGNLLASATNVYTPASGGTFYAASRMTLNECSSATRTAVSLTINVLPNINIAPDNPICSEDFTTYSVTFTTDATEVSANIGILTNDDVGVYSISEVPVTSSIVLQLNNESTSCANEVVIESPNCINPCDTITVNPPLSDGDIEVCEGDEIPPLSVTTEDGVLVDWYDAPTGGNILASATNNLVVNESGTYYAESRTETGDCISNERTPVTLTIKESPQFQIDNNGLVCSEDGSNYSFTFTTNADVVTASDGELVQSAENTYTINEIPAGQDVTISLTNNETECTATETINAPDCPCTGVVVDPPVAVPSFYEACMSDPTPTFTVTVKEGETVYWYDVEEGGTPLVMESLTFTPPGPGTYYAETRTIDGNCPSNSRTPVTLELLPNPTFELEAGSPICAIDIKTYSIVFRSDADEISVNEGIIEDLGGGRYAVSEVPVDVDLIIELVHLSTGCMLEQTIERPDCPVPACAEPNVFIPNTFTPNGDGNNDVFRVRSEIIEEMELIVYTRWGEKVFSAKNQSQEWDGTFKGEELPPDVYGYYLNVMCTGGEVYTKKGDVTLMR